MIQEISSLDASHVAYSERALLPEDMKTRTNAVLPVFEAKSAEDIDMAFKQLHEGVDVEEVIVPSMIEKLQDHSANKSKLPAVEARSLEDIHKAFQQAPESSPAELPPSSGYTKTENNVALPVLEARSAEDIDLAFRQLQEGVDVEEVIVPIMIEKLQDYADNKPKLPVVEARSLQDIHKNFHQVPESSPVELPHSSGLKNKSSKDIQTKTNVDHGDIRSKLPVVEARSLEDIHKAFQQAPESIPAEQLPSSGYTKVETNVVLPVLEARSAEDIDLAFKQLHEGVDVEEIIVPSMIEKLQDHIDSKETLPVVEARSLEDIYKVFHEPAESSQPELPHSSGLKNKSSKNTKTQTNVVLPVLEAKSAEDIDMAFKQLHEGVDVEEVMFRISGDIHNAFQQAPESSPAELPPSSGHTKTENNVVLPVLEARSVEDIDLVFKQLQGVDVEESRQDLWRIYIKHFNKLQNLFQLSNRLLQAIQRSRLMWLPVLEARSAEDIDLAFKQLHEGVDVEEIIVPSLKNKSSKDTKTETNVVLPVLEAKSAEDIDLAFKQLNEGVDVEEVIVPSMIEKPQDHGDIKSKLPVVEARSLEDIHKQLHEGVDVEEVIVPNMIEKPQDHGDIKSKLPVVEARSPEDIHKVFHQNPESSQPEMPHSSGLKNKSSKDTKTETNVVLPALEAKSAEDIDLAFKQLPEGIDVEEVIIQSIIEKPKDHGDVESELPTVEARSLEDIHKAFQQAPESSSAELPLSSGYTKTETNVALPVLEARSAEDIDLAFKQLHVGVDVEEVIVPSMIEKTQDHGDIKSKLPVVEAKYLEDYRTLCNKA
ncbi:Far1-related sequence 3 [Hibiscus syriacus]|uniref:Far1-related sequence 3 n=1 Tax=Hibiscus syriacus TaxID=106335 RepID=A0A6A3CYY4_HIBSY|nr:Far1-related sequence 3 [Hibiscus syriacus]